LYRYITAAVFILLTAVLQVPIVLAQAADQGVVLAEVSSRLGQPLQARLVLNTGEQILGEAISVTVAKDSEFQKLQIRRYQVVDLIELTLNDDMQGGQVLQLTTNKPIYEPSLRLVVSLTTDVGKYLLPLELLLPSPDALGLERRTTLVYPNDTLWRIADRTRAASVTNSQQMLAVQRLNPTAFVRDNINGLREWSMLSLPTVAQAQQMPAGEAAQSVAAQHALWRSDLPIYELGPDEGSGQVRITEAQDLYADSDLTGVDVQETETFDEPYVSVLADSDDGRTEADEMTQELVGAFDLMSDPEGQGEDSDVSAVEVEAFDGDTDVEPRLDALDSDAKPADAQGPSGNDPFDLDSLEAQIRQEQGSRTDALLNEVISPRGAGLLAAVFFVALLVLLLIRRRAAEQERELDHALRGEEPLLAEDSQTTPQGTESEASTPTAAVPEDVYTTRLKLAEAYLEMGDTDGAAEMLEEVIADGSPEQQEVARRIRERVDSGDE